MSGLLLLMDEAICCDVVDEIEEDVGFLKAVNEVDWDKGD